jgi:tRNA (guanine37-N1)-methyltransferase
MWVGVITLFPDIFLSFQDMGVVGRAIKSGLVELNTYNPRDFATDNYRRVDDYSYGGGPGMVLKFELLKKALDSAKQDAPRLSQVIMMSPQGETFSQSRASSICEEKSVILVSGRYEGVDQRFLDNYVDLELSIGDYILSGGELPAMVVIDAISRCIPGVLGNSDSFDKETYVEGLFDYPHYTRPDSVDGLDVPKDLLSGDPLKVGKFRRQEALIKTYEKRPDLLLKTTLDDADREILREYLSGLSD